MGSYPFYTDGKFGTNLVLRSDSDLSLSDAVKETAELVRSLGADPEFE